MSKWMGKLINKHTCHFCQKHVDKKSVYSITMDTADGAHTVSSCEECATSFDDMLKQIEEARNG